jgi:hypothetical protein
MKRTREITIMHYGVRRVIKNLAADYGPVCDDSD